MSDKLIVHKGRTNVVIVELGFDASAETYASQIRSEPNVESPLLAEWEVSFVTDGSDGKLQLFLSETVTAQIVPQSGYMDLKRTVGFINSALFDQPLEVSFRGTVTD